MPAVAAAARGVAEQAESDATKKVLADVRNTAEGLQMKGGTALYDAVFVALKHMLDEREKNPGYQYSVVAFTDGESNQGRTIEAFKRDYAALPEDVKERLVHLVLCIDADGRVIEVAPWDVLTRPVLDPKIFKAYDVRGTYPDQIDEETARTANIATLNTADKRGKI